MRCHHGPSLSSVILELLEFSLWVYIVTLSLDLSWRGGALGLPWQRRTKPGTSILSLKILHHLIRTRIFLEQPLFEEYMICLEVKLSLVINYFVEDLLASGLLFCYPDTRGLCMLVAFFTLELFA